VRAAAKARRSRGLVVDWDNRLLTTNRLAKLGHYPLRRQGAVSRGCAALWVGPGRELGGVSQASRLAVCETVVRGVRDGGGPLSGMPEDGRPDCHHGQSRGSALTAAKQARGSHGVHRVFHGVSPRQQSPWCGPSAPVSWGEGRPSTNCLGARGKVVDAGLRRRNSVCRPGRWLAWQGRCGGNVGFSHKDKGKDDKAHKAFVPDPGRCLHRGSPKSSFVTFLRPS
jgi:hypothetical protein